jgi:hypothetical protein
LAERALVGKLSAAAIAACRMSMSVEFRSWVCEPPYLSQALALYTVHSRPLM